MIVVGDLHLCNHSDNPIKHKQSKMFMDWFSEQEFNNKNEKCLFLGDVAEYNINFETLFELKNWIDSLKFKEIIWIQGNHDCVVGDSVLNVFKNDDRIQLVTQPTLYKDTDVNKQYLLLPFYSYESTSYMKMEERYSNIYKEFDISFDYGFGHICDETQKFSENAEICDTSKLNIGFWLNGHVHTPNFNKGGHYLGSVVKNSSTEKDDKKYIARITEEKCDYIEVPNFMDYVTCEYGEFPTIETPLALIQVNNAPSKFDAEKLYREHYKDVDIGFTKILTKRNNVMNNETKIDTVDENELFDAFAKEKNLNNSVIDICRKVIC